LGRTLLVDTGVRKVRRAIVGIIDDVRSEPPDPRPLPVVYVPHSQAPTPDMAFVVRLEHGQPMPFAAIRDIIRSIDPGVPAFSPSTMQQVLSNADWLARFVAQLLGLFTFVGLALVAAGIYGVLAFVVAKRQREFGLRLALGARFTEIARIVLGFVARVVAVGVAIGMLGFLALGRMLDSLLFGVTRTDSATFAGVIAIITAVTFVVCVSPLRKALRVSPLIVMNVE
jgi:ABC-type antimicrobial peptide transport system permease subunit